MNGQALNVIINAEHLTKCLSPSEHPILVSYCRLTVTAIIVDVGKVPRLVGVWHIANTK